MTSTFKPRRLAALLCAAMATLPGAPALAQPLGANVNITPKRMTLDRTHRSATIFVYNQGSSAATFDIGMIDRVMLPDGQIVAVQDTAGKPDQAAVAGRLKSAKDMLLISPRRVSLAPRQGQTIRVRATTLPEGDAPAEFRSHLTIATLPERTEGTTAESVASADPNQLQIRINAQYGVSIPVIARAGAPDVRAAIENATISYANLRMSPTSPIQRTAVVSFDLVRQGANSLFGNIDIRLAQQKREDQAAGIAYSLGVYAEIDRRRVSVPLRLIPAPGERMEITFTDDDQTPGKVLAKAAL